MSDNEDYFYSPADDYYSSNDESYLHSPLPGSLSYLIKHPPVPPVIIEPGEGSSSSRATIEEKDKAPLVEEMENPTPAVAVSELDVKKKNKGENQNQVEPENKRGMEDDEPEIMPVQKKAKTI